MGLLKILAGDEDKEIDDATLTVLLDDIEKDTE